MPDTNTPEIELPEHKMRMLRSEFVMRSSGYGKALNGEGTPSEVSAAREAFRNFVKGWLAARPEPVPGQEWKCGNEFLPFHPSASHITPEYRDGWNHCFAARAAILADRERHSQPVARVGVGPVALTKPWFEMIEGKTLPDGVHDLYTVRAAMGGDAK